MTNQNTISSREQWLSDLRKSRSEYRPVGRKLGSRGSSGGAVPKHYQSMANKSVVSTQIFPAVKPNPFPFNRQHKSKVLYRSLDKSSTVLSVNSKTLKHNR